MTELVSIWGRRWVRNWAATGRGQRNLEELLDLGYHLGPPPMAGAARNFDAVDDQIARSADDAALDVADADSLIAQILVKLDAVGTAAKGLITKKNNAAASAAGWMLEMQSNEIVRFDVSDGADQVTQADASAIVVGTWYAFTGILTANAAANDDVSLYRDETLNGPTNSLVLGSLENTIIARVGVFGNLVGSSFFPGDIAYARVWKKAGAAWTASERAQVVEARNILYLPADTPVGGMQMQWILWDDGAPTTARDYSGNGLSGTYTGTTFVNDPHQVRLAIGGVVPVQKVSAAPPAAHPRPFVRTDGIWRPTW